FELLLTEHLIHRCLVRKSRILPLVVEYVVVLVAGERRFDIDQDTVVSVGIRDLPNRAMRPLIFWRISLLIDRRGGAQAFIADLLPRQINLDAEIGSCIADEGV